MKTVRIFSDRIRNRIRLEGLRSVRIRVWISNIRYRIRIRILKSDIYDVDIQSYPIRHSWHYPYSNPNPDRNMKTNVISVISVRIRSVFIPTLHTNDNEPSSIASCVIYIFVSCNNLRSPGFICVSPSSFQATSLIKFSGNIFIQTLYMWFALLIILLLLYNIQ